MSVSTLKKWIFVPLFAAGGLWFTWAVLLGQPNLSRASTWQTMASPGQLSSAHAFLANNCAACHTSNKGVEARNCIVCHADNKSLLQRQPSAFHADVGECAVCHLEHQGRIPNSTKMDHVALAGIGLRQVQHAGGAQDLKHDALLAWVKRSNGVQRSPQLHPEESPLNCATCHQTKDRHNGLFGADCSQCHGTTEWTLPEFRHPSPVSQSCTQCHQAPPSHYMMHFKMIDQAICGKPNAKVDQCFLCHQTTSWNDIRGVGWYKHH